MSYALVADLGGTNARFALVAIGQYEIQEIQILSCKEYDTLFLALDVYIEQSSVEMEMIDAVVLAIAGPINQEVIRFSNNNWEFTREDVDNYFGINKEIALLNDFDANGHCLDVIKSDELIKVSGTMLPEKKAPAWVVGAGTGLGVACVIPQPAGASLLLAGEGGHADLPSATEQEDYILNYLRERHHRVSAERVLSGMGIENIYAALAHRQEITTRLTASEIGMAYKNGDLLATRCMEQFFVYLGRVIGNLILNVEPRGGVYIAGGIVPRYQEELIKSGFCSALEDKGRMSSLVSAIPIYIIMAENPGLMGCAHYASHLIKNLKKSAEYVRREK